MKLFQRMWFVSLVLILALGLLVVPAGAVQGSELTDVTVIEPVAYANPLYGGEVDLSDFDLSGGPALLTEPEYVTPEENAEILRQYMLAHSEAFTLYIATERADYDVMVREILAAAVSHTGSPTEGDYLAYQFGGYGFTGSRGVSGSQYLYTLNFSVTYYTTAQQEAELDTAVAQLLTSLDLEGRPDEQKIWAIYDYICGNVTYDYTNLDDAAYKLKYTAYAALMDGTAVCQGYANLFYRLALEAGVDSRIICGIGAGGAHAWNIVKMDDLYYNLDATWDAESSSYRWYLRSEKGFTNHTRENFALGTGEDRHIIFDYTSQDFYTAYPMSATNYEPIASGSLDCGVDWTFDKRTGKLTMEAAVQSAIPSFTEEERTAKEHWFAYADRIIQIEVGKNIYGIGDYAFYNCNKLESVVLNTVAAIGGHAFGYSGVSEIRFTGDAPAIDAAAFTDVTATAYYPVGNDTWDTFDKGNYGGNITWVGYVGVCTGEHQWSEWTPVSEANCTEAGKDSRLCTVCSVSEERELPVDPAAHGLHHYEATTATCVARGNVEYWYCVHCHVYFANESASETVTTVHTDIDPANHTGGTEVRSAKAATCTTAGYSGDTHCKGCGEKVAAGESLPLAAHAMTHHAAVAATCAAEGNVEYWRCGSCGRNYASAAGGAVLTDVTADKDSSNHIGGTEVRSAKAATCQETGYTGDTHCLGCGAVLQSGGAVPQSGHTYTDVVTPPTCIDRGYTTHTCAVCADSYVDSYTDTVDHSYEKTVLEPTQTAPGCETYTCTVCGDSYEKIIPALGTPFTDVPPGAYYENAVSWAVANSVTTGTGPSTFSPDRNCTRAQVVTFLWRAAGEPEPASDYNPFADVDPGEYYYKAVLWAVEQEITNGISANEFGSGDICTRGQVATFLWRAQGKPAASSGENPFTDVAPGAYYYNAVLWAVEEGVTTGTGAATFSPDQNCTRGQIVTFLYRAMG